MTVDAESRRAHRAAAARRRAAANSQAPGYRRDIDGLRAVAILLVVVYHVWIGRVSGGVDVFLMISAFFLTGSFVRAMQAGRPLAVGSFLLSRFRRLMPAASVVLAATLGACWLLFPQTAWPRLWKEGWASLGYVQNWVLAIDGVDYYAHDSALASPLQHFWSLSVQGQVFVLWPVLFLLGALLVRWTKKSPTAVMAWVFGLVFAVSLAFSIWETADLQTFAYFDTRARLWEFAAGSLLALTVPRLRVNRLLRAVLGWIGLIGVAVCGMVIDVRGGFPGYLALWPIFAAALVIVAGTRPKGEHPELGELGPGRLLATRPVLFLGRDAYALYLVHWPVLILWLNVRERPEASFLDGLGIIAISLVLARLVTAFVEQPLRLPGGQRGSKWRNAGVMLLCVGIVAAVLVPWQQITTTTVTAQQATHVDEYTGAMGGDTAGDGKGVPVIPVPGDEDGRWAKLDGPCTGRFASDQPEVQESCTQTMNASNAKHLVVVIGDSHANEFAGALQPVAKERDWGIVMLMRPWCSLDKHEEGTEADGYCGGWQRAALDKLIEIHPDAMFTIVTAAAPDSPDERVINGIDEVIDEVTAAGIPLFGVRDNPRTSKYNYWECAVNKEPCDFPLSGALAETNPAASLGDRIGLVDFTPWICPNGTCYTELGHVSVYLDNNHLSFPFVKTLAPALDQQLGDFLKP
ncbi:MULTISPECIES: acyltransferase family protein [unclassified Microbacterium]|uniref:acyltransferase family protein n=1 Tax=unclassified Microbacterium TaxID=2609290 RepID=UPI0036640BB1